MRVGGTSGAERVTGDKSPLQNSVFCILSSFYLLSPIRSRYFSSNSLNSRP